MKARMVLAVPPIRKTHVGGRSRRHACFSLRKHPVSPSLHRGLSPVVYDFALANGDELVSYTVAKPRKAPVCYYTHSNHLYSVAAVTNSVGAVVERYSYNAYGVPTIKNSANATIAKSVVGNDRGFTGFKLDNESGLYFARERMYSAKLGRFISRDPLGVLAGLNFYCAYFAVNGVDPFGLIDGAIDAAIAALEELTDDQLGKIDWRLLARTLAEKQLDSLYDSAKAEAQSQGLTNTGALDALHQQYKNQLLSAMELRIGMVDSKFDGFNAEVRSKIRDVANYAFENKGQTAAAALALTAAAVYAETKTGTAILPKEYGTTIKVNVFKTGTLSVNATAFRAGFANFGVRAGGARFDSRQLVLKSGVTISAFASCPDTKVEASLKEGLNAQYGGDVRVGISVFVPGNN